MQIKSCPHCKSTDVEVIQCSYVKCNHCYMTGPRSVPHDEQFAGHYDHVDEVFAIDLWNSLPRR